MLITKSFALAFLVLTISIAQGAPVAPLCDKCGGVEANSPLEGRTAIIELTTTDGADHLNHLGKRIHICAFGWCIGDWSYRWYVPTRPEDSQLAEGWNEGNDAFGQYEGHGEDGLTEIEELQKKEDAAVEAAKKKGLKGEKKGVEKREETEQKVDQKGEGGDEEAEEKKPGMWDHDLWKAR